MSAAMANLNLCAVSETLCSVEDIQPSNLTIAPIPLDDFFIHRSGEITIGREHHKYLNAESIQDPVWFDLDQGLETFDIKPRSEGIPKLMKYLMLKADQLNTRDLKTITKNADVVCRRGGIARIGYSHYETKGYGWKFAVEKFNDILFMAEVNTEGKRESFSNPDPWTRRTEYWGHKFESLIFAKKGQKPNPFEPVSTWEEMYATFGTTFPASGDQRMLKLYYSAEIDGLEFNGRHAEAKVQAESNFNNYWFKEKAMRWWLQSKLAGIDKVIIGFREENVVTKVRQVELDKLAESRTEWDRSVCLKTAQQVINKVREKYDQLVKPGELMLIERKPDERIIRYSVVSPGGQSILTPEFKARFRN